MKTAVILAARKEKESSIPYPLRPYTENHTLMDRAIGILEENGYSRIFIVVGFCAELFRRFESDKIHLVFNKNYEFTSSMGSLSCIDGMVDDDFLLLEGDTFYESDVIRTLASIDSGNCLSITEESGSGDECFIETKNGFVKKITKDRHQVCNIEGELMGVSRISYDTFKKMIAAWEKSSNPFLNYEYLLMDVTEPLDRPYVRFTNTIWGDVDCEEDFKRLSNKIYRRLRRKENPFDEDNLRRYLHDIFPDKDQYSFNIAQIGGMSNKNFLVEYGDEKYVLRVPGNGSEGMVERTNEEFNAIEGCKLGLNPCIRYFNAETGIKLADYIRNAETLNPATIQRYGNMKKIADIYKKLHNSRIRLKNEFNIFQEIEKYNLLLKKSNARMYDGWEEIQKMVMNLESHLNSIGIDLKPCHNDAISDNFIKDSNGVIYLIDWEYSGMNDPMADLAALFIESDFTEENRDFVLQTYFEGKIPEKTLEKILCYQILWDYLWAQWTVIKEANGDDFGSYGKDRFNRAKNNLTKLIQFKQDECK